MEKIYENNSKKNKRSKKMKLNGSTCLTFSIALIAVFALMAVGVTGISYAFPQPEDYNDSITRAALNKTYYYTDTSQFYYQATSTGEPLFCIERDVDIPDITATPSYSKDAEITNAGLYYILSYVDTKDAVWDLDGITIDNTGTKGTTLADSDVKYWAGQAAIYYYLADSTTTTKDMSTELNKIKAVSTSEDISVNPTYDPNLTDMKYFKANSGTLFDSIKVEGKSITTLITEAKNKSSTGEALAEVTITAKDDVIQTDSEKKFYFSPEYTLNVVTTGTYISEVKNLKVTLGGAPDGTKLVDKDGVELDPSNMSTSKTFYVRVPADKVTKDTKITIDVEANVNATTAYKYIATSEQSLGVLGVKDKVLNTSTTLSLTPAGDTGMNVGQTVYFIGLIVLLCGVGIIYANAKPSQVKE